MCSPGCSTRARGGSDERIAVVASGICCGICGTCAVGRGSSGDRGAGVQVLLAVAGHAGGSARRAIHAAVRGARHCATRRPSGARRDAAHLLIGCALAVRAAFGYTAALMGESLVQLRGVARHPRQPKPEWLKVRMRGGGRNEHVKRTLRELNLHTVCEEASCPNVGECWGGGTATVMLMGDVCTRGCRFCDVASGTPAPLDPLEPRHLAEAVGRLGLDYLVVTSVNRDELPDGGASHFAQAIVELRRAAPHTLVEVLTADFQGDSAALDMIIDAQPAVAAHNIETVERLTPRVRDRRAAYRQSLEVLAHYKRGGMRTKSSIMLGLGERRDEVLQAMRDLRSVGCDILTLGQYLRPTEKHLPIEEYVRPEVFRALEQEGLELGFRFVASGPLVRSSYKAGEFFVQRWVEEERRVASR